MRHPNDPDITPAMLGHTGAELEAMTPVEYRDQVVPIMNALSIGPFPRRGGPFGILGRWLKQYSRKRVYEVLVFLYKGGKRTDHFVPVVTLRLKEGYSESVEYPELDVGARYGEASR